MIRNDDDVKGLIEKIIEQTLKNTRRRKKSLNIFSQMQALKDQIVSEDKRIQEKEYKKLIRQKTKNPTQNIIKIKSSKGKVRQSKVNVVIGKNIKKWKPEFDSDMKSLYEGKMVKFVYCKDYTEHFMEYGKIKFANLYDFPRNASIVKVEEGQEEPRKKKKARSRVMRKACSTPKLFSSKQALQIEIPKLERDLSKKHLLKTPLYRRKFKGISSLNVL